MERKLRKKRIGHWATHDYKRRSVEKDITEFIGWEGIVSKCIEIDSLMYKVLFATAFATCGRISEVIRLRKNNFTIDEETIWISKMLNLKRYDKEYGYKIYSEDLPEDHTKHLWTYDERNDEYSRLRYATTLKTEYRKDFDIPRSEPLTELIVNWVERSKDFLFPGYSRDDRFPEMSGEHIHRNTAWLHLNRVGIYPHWTRGQRASCLKAFYNLPDEIAMDWAGWEDAKTFKNYAKMGATSITKMMGRPAPKEATILEEKLMGQLAPQSEGEGVK